MTESLLGTQVILSPMVPEPRPITPGEWAEAYVRWRMREVLVASGHPEKVPRREPRWTDQIHTAYITTYAVAYPSLDRPVEFVADFDFVEALNDQRRRHEAQSNLLHGFALVSKSDWKSVYKITGV